MKSDRLAEPALKALALAVIIYVSFYSFDRHMRVRKGGWQVLFQADAAGVPAIVINEPALHLTNITLAFPGERVTNAVNPRLVVFNNVDAKPAFGGLIFEDLTYLPGTV